MKIKKTTSYIYSIYHFLLLYFYTYFFRFLIKFLKILSEKRKRLLENAKTNKWNSWFWKVLAQWRLEFRSVLLKMKMVNCPLAHIHLCIYMIITSKASANEASTFKNTTYALVGVMKHMYYHVDSTHDNS